MPNETPFPERWLAERKASRPDSKPLAAIESALTEEGVDESRLLGRLKALVEITNTREDT